MSTKKFDSRDITKPLHGQHRSRLHRSMKVAAMPLLFLLLTAALHGQSALDGFDPNADGDINVIVVQADGKILIGGSFHNVLGVARNRIARLNTNGTLDTAFNPGASNYVSAIALQADGKILVGGGFGTIGGQQRNHIARLDATTGVADSFNPNADGDVTAIAVQANGKILAGGDFGNIGGQTRNSMAQLDAVSGLADSFDPNVGGVIPSVRSIVVQADSKILVCGYFSNIGGQTRRNIARLDAVTGLPDSFDPNAMNTGGSSVLSIAVQADGKILAGGNFTAIGGQTRNRVARLDPTSGQADSFNPNASGGLTGAVWAIAVQADGRILAGGEFTSIGGQARSAIARLDPATGLADPFNPNANATVFAIATQADAKILAGGIFTTLAPNGGAAETRNRIARLETDGRLDQTLDLSTVGTAVFATAVQPDGKILIGGRFTSVQGTPRNRIARLNTDGALDLAFDPNANGEVFSIAVQANGKILVGGGFNGAASIGGQLRNRIARLDGTTGLADSFDPNANRTVYSIVVQADGKILVCGQFTSIGGATRNYIARLNATTGLVDPADLFDPNAKVDVISIAVQADGKILAGGFFTSIGGQPRNCIARLDASTGLADSFNPNVHGDVFSILVQMDGKILVGGAFTSIGGQTRNRIARLDATTGLADSFNPNANDFVLSIAVQADGKILAGGAFNSIGGQTRNGIARLDATTGLVDPLDPFNPNAGGSVATIAVQSDGKILVGGSFANIGGQARSLFARLTNDTAALQNLAVTPTTVTWTRGGASATFARVTFESSTDSVTFTPLGNGIPQSGSSNWTLTGLSLPTGQNIYIRARGYHRSGHTTGSESITESVRNAFIPEAGTFGTLGNISTRLRVLGGDNALIGGLIATGTATKRVILRAIGPTLTDLGVPGALADPTLELYQGNTLLLSNDDWRISSQEAEIKASGFAPNKDLESAIIWTLTPGQGYTAIVRGKNGETGIGVVEAYDLDHAAASKLGNISTRGFVDVGDNVMIAGLIVTPNNGTSARILVRALGPTLTDLGVPGALPNPTLDLVNSSGAVIRSNNDWMDDPLQRSAIEAAGLAPNHNEEAALVETVAPGAYTAIVRGTGATPTGVALVEVYHLP